MSGHPNGGEQRLCKITGHQAPLVWFFERAQDLNSACPCSTSSSTTWARHSPRGGEASTSQVIFSTEQGLRGGVASRSQPTRVSATALGRGRAHPLPAGAFRSMQNYDSGGGGLPGAARWDQEGPRAVAKMDVAGVIKITISIQRTDL